MITEINRISAKQLVTKIKSRELSAEEVMRCFLDRIAYVNPSLNAVVQIDADNALEQARKIDITLARGGFVGKLSGLPFTVKNVCKVKGFTPDKGCAGLRGLPPPSEDATVVARLRKEGAILIGLTNTPELSIGFETDNLVYGRTNNPYHLEYSPAGSSGGEAAIIAAGGSPFGIGSDATGSIRVPAHSTGIVGLKATQGRVPFTGNIPFDGAGLFSQFISFGPMAKYIEDIDFILPIMAGPDNRDPHVVPAPLYNPKSVNLAELKIAYYHDDGIAIPAEEIVATIQDAALALQDRVKQVVEDKPSVLKEIDLLLSESILLGGDEGEWLVDILSQLQIKKPSYLLQEFLALAKNCKFSITDLRKRWVQFDQYRIAMLEFLDNYDAIICPTAATTAKKHGQSFKEIRDFSYAMCYTLTGWPAVVVRCGTNKEGLPIGVQIIARPWREDVALTIAQYLEDSFGGWYPPPERIFKKER